MEPLGLSNIFRGVSAIMTNAAKAPQYLPGLLLVLLVFALLNHTGSAHEIRPTIIDLQMGGSGQFTLTLRTNLEALMAGIGTEHRDTDESDLAAEYNRLRRLPPARLETGFEGFIPRLLAGSDLRADGAPVRLELAGVSIPQVGNTAVARDSIVKLRGRLSADSEILTWTWKTGFGPNVLRVDSASGEEIYTAYLQAGHTSAPVPLAGTLTQSTTGLFLDYVGIGFDHILPRGTDHILFVIGLFLLNARLSSLLWQVSSFTLAHTLTLALGIYGIVQIPATIVEPLIAASIVYVCVENLMYDHLTRWRPLVVFVFGLLHGLGFAGVLKDIGLEPDHFVTGLVAFNVGVELGQLTVIAGCFFALGLWFSRRSWYRQFITLPASLLIALIGGYWFVERIAVG